MLANTEWTYTSAFMIFHYMQHGNFIGNKRLSKTENTFYLLCLEKKSMLFIRINATFCIIHHSLFLHSHEDFDQDVCLYGCSVFDNHQNSNDKKEKQMVIEISFPRDSLPAASITLISKSVFLI